MKIFFAILAVAAIGSYWFYFKLGFHMIHVPAVGDFSIGWLYIPLFIGVVVFTANAVNITDGLDGLAIGPVTINAATYMLFAYVAGHATLSAYLQIPRVVGAGELAIVCGAMVGSGLGFLWFNSYPAEVFMGDVGSL